MLSLACFVAVGLVLGLLAPSAHLCCSPVRCIPEPDGTCKTPRIKATTKMPDSTLRFGLAASALTRTNSNSA